MKVFQVFVFVSVVVAASVANADYTYVDAVDGEGGNTVNSATLSPTDWCTTPAYDDDNLWSPDDNSHWMGGWQFATRSEETSPELCTTITGLTPSSQYDIYVVYGECGWEDARIQAGLISGSLTEYGEDGTYVGEDLRGAFVGTTTSDTNGNIAVYIAGVDGYTTRYDGVAYEAVSVPEPSSILLLICGIIGLLFVRRRG